MSAESATAILRSQVDLLDFIDWSGVECLNQSSSHSLANALKQGYREDDGLHLESDADEQLLIYIPFTQVVKLHSIAVKGPEEEGPKTVKLFSNKEHMGFSNVGDFPPSDTVVLSSNNIEGKPIVLKYVKFQNVRSLTIFIEDNQSGSEITKVQKFVLYGSTTRKEPGRKCGCYGRETPLMCQHLKMKLIVMELPLPGLEGRMALVVLDKILPIANYLLPGKGCLHGYLTANNPIQMRESRFASKIVVQRSTEGSLLVIKFWRDMDIHIQTEAKESIMMNKTFPARVMESLLSQFPQLQLGRNGNNQ